VVIEIRSSEAGYRAPSLQHQTSYLWSSSVVSRAFSVLCTRYACIRRSGIIFTPRLPLCQFSFLSRSPLLS